MTSTLRPTVAAAVAKPRVSHGLAALALALLLGLQPVTTDIYLPALPMLTRELGASMTAAQLTMSALILAFGIGQLFWGPIADRLGRRPVLLLGLSLYLLASLGAAFAPGIGSLIAWRVVQGASLSAAVVVARAVLRDLYPPHEGARVMALAMSGLALIAIVGPALGGLVTELWGWRAALALVAGAGAATLAFIGLRLPETLATKNPQATRLKPLIMAWSRIGRHRGFVAWTALTSCSYGGLFTLLAGSSFIYIGVLGMSPRGYGFAMASGSLSYLAGNLLCRRWIARVGPTLAVWRGGFFTLAGGVSMALLALSGVNAVWAVLLPQWLFCFGHGIHQPCGQAGAVGPFPQAAGTASALAGFVLAVVAFGTGKWLGWALDGTVLPFALCLAFWSVSTAVIAWTLVQRAAR